MMTSNINIPHDTISRNTLLLYLSMCIYGRVCEYKSSMYNRHKSYNRQYIYH